MCETGFLKRKGEYNPDVLSCLANLSNDEVFTPPEIANRMLDLLPQEIFRDPDATFLDPACKTGVFLREIAKRLMDGLKEAIPDEAARREHIFRKQLFGIAITELTALMSRRTVYCTKDASCGYSVVKFETSDGNIRFKPTRHKWKNGRCAFCGASRRVNDRAAGLETHAYEFIHKTDPKEIFNMHFDVIIGNPPYQMNDGGGTGSSAGAIYNRFVEAAKKLNPTFLVMIIPSRWMTGGKGLDFFRKSMLEDRHIEELHDFIDAKTCFPGVSIEAGVCYFKRSEKHEGKCHVTTHQADGSTVESDRYLNNGDSDIVIRDANVIGILQKVKDFGEGSFESVVSTRNPFGVVGNVERFISKKESKCKILCRYESKRQFLNLRNDFEIKRNREMVGRWKLFVSKADGAAGQLGNPIPARIIGKAELGAPNTICSETFLCISAKGRREAENIAAYMATKFFRFMVGIRKNKNMTHETYLYAPLQDFSRPWTDAELYAKYGLTAEEIAFIESMIRPMEAGA